MKYVVDVFRTYAKTVEVEAESDDLAEEIALENERERAFDPSEYSLTEDIDVSVSGYVDEGERHYN